MKYFLLAIIAILFLIASGIMGKMRSGKTIAKGNIQVSASDIVVDPVDRTYSAIRDYFGKAQ